MGKKKRVSLITLVVVGIWLIGMLLSCFLYLQVIQKEKELAEYLNSPVCPTSDCRQEIDAKVIHAKTILTSYSWGPVKGHNEPGTETKSKKYTFDLSISNITRSVDVILSPTVSLDGFNRKNIFIPSNEYLTFAEDNFASRQPIQIEIWKQRITFLLIPDSEISILPEQKVLIVPSPIKDSQALAIPASQHPLIALEIARGNYDNGFAALLVATLALPVFWMMFRRRS